MNSSTLKEIFHTYFDKHGRIKFTTAYQLNEIEKRLIGKSIEIGGNVQSITGHSQITCEFSLLYYYDPGGKYPNKRIDFRSEATFDNKVNLFSINIDNLIIIEGRIKKIEPDISFSGGPKLTIQVEGISVKKSSSLPFDRKYFGIEHLVNPDPIVEAIKIKEEKNRIINQQEKIKEQKKKQVNNVIGLLLGIPFFWLCGIILGFIVGWPIGCCSSCSYATRNDSSGWWENLFTIAKSTSYYLSIALPIIFVVIYFINLIREKDN